MSKKAKKAQSAISPVTEAQPAKVAPKDLLDQVQAIKAIAQCYNLLQKGMYPHGFAPAIDQSLQFLQVLHTQALQAAQAHPDAALVPELQTQGQGA